MQKILFTGASGFIGRALLPELLECNYDVAIVSRKDNAHVLGVKSYRCNLEDTNRVLEILNHFRPDTIIHNAAQSRISEPMLDFSKNVLPTLNLIDLACLHSVKKFIFASSGGAIYGEVPSLHKASVTDLVFPNNSYAAGKIIVENYLHLYSRTKRLDYNILRYANVLGRFKLDENLDFIIPKLTKNAFDKEPLAILGREKLGDSGLLRDYISVDDIVKVNLLCLDGTIQEKIINVSSGRSISTLEIASLVNEFFGSHSEIQFLEPRRGDIKRSVLDSAPLEQYLKPNTFEASLEAVLKNIQLSY